VTRPAHGRTPPCFCPHCGQLITGWGSAVGERPSAGDASICAYCGVLAVYTDTLALRLPTSDELTELLADPDIHKAMLDAMLAIQRRQFPIGAPHGKGTKQ
jgi:hypothetical protein